MHADYDLNTKAGRIGYAIERSGHTPSSISRLLDCAPAAVYQWINGSTKNLKEHLLWKLSDITLYEARWLSLGEGPMMLSPGLKHANQVLQAMQPEALYTAVKIIDTLIEQQKNNDINHH
jgi:hypothetical protein